MKKFVLFLLIATLGVALTSCSWFDSAPVNPKIIGIGNLEYDSKSGLLFAVIDSTQYTVAKVTIPDHNVRSFSVTQDIQPVDGMQVTVFTYSLESGIQAVAGNQSVEEIEELYHRNYTFGVAFLILILIWICMLVYEDNHECAEPQPEHGRIIGYRISPTLVIHSCSEYAVIPPILAEYLDRLGGRMLREPDIDILLQNWDAISDLRVKAGDTPLKRDNFWFRIDDVPVVYYIKNGSYGLNVMAFSDFEALLILKR